MGTINLQTILLWLTMGGGFLLNGVALVACAIGTIYPALRREFIWLVIAGLLRFAAFAFFLLPQILRMTSSSILTPDLYQAFSTANGITGVVSMAVYCVAVILLVLRVRGLARQ